MVAGGRIGLRHQKGGTAMKSRKMKEMGEPLGWSRSLASNDIPIRPFLTPSSRPHPAFHTAVFPYGFVTASKSTGRRCSL